MAIVEKQPRLSGQERVLQMLSAKMELSKETWQNAQLQRAVLKIATSQRAGVMTKEVSHLRLHHHRFTTPMTVARLTKLDAGTKVHSKIVADNASKTLVIPNAVGNLQVPQHMMVTRVRQWVRQYKENSLFPLKAATTLATS